jgi:hypothetical protein
MKIPRRRRSFLFSLIFVLLLLWVLLTFSSQKPLTSARRAISQKVSAGDAPKLLKEERIKSNHSTRKQRTYLKSAHKPRRTENSVPISAVPTESWDEQNRPRSNSGSILAYLAIISNEDFVDGALVLGRSLRNHSLLLANRTADLAILVTSGRISKRSKGRLQRDGTYDEVIEVQSLAARAPGAYWKDTFDKIYMFNLTQYHKIIFMDADMICVRSMDELFFKNFGDPSFVGAIGFRGGSEGPYFQTGMMVIQPRTKMFSRIFSRFESGVPPRGNEYNHGMNGRDGVLLRDVFGDRFKIVDNKYSRNLNPRWQIPGDVISLHLRGKVKPWFDRRLPNSDPELGKKEFGFPYLLFWDIYEELHKGSLEYEQASKGMPLDEPFGGAVQGPGVSPLTHVWMMRYSKKEYVQLRRDEDRRRRLLPIGGSTGLSFHAGLINESCDATCSQAGAGTCDLSLFNASQLQDCEFLKRELKCATCELGVYWRPHPGNDYPAVDFAKGKNICKFNLMFDERSIPTCSARNETTARLCPCSAARGAVTGG